ncbi:hypothetical protein [Acetonema longum]|uniref:Uncharacterized protein n=1 Tax=Acetonema longum DSM 6540 TaxID=1009370 RepID=F7NIK8_9FIRM|nr:hypothetical protein [Acetonema longum]EGO64154.1 hypothetical protein ALO_09554 [Acetonema longum DSM 6540]
MKGMDKMDYCKPSGVNDLDKCCHQPKWTHQCDCQEDMHHTDCCEMPPMKCKTEKECVKVFKCYYKLYRICQYRLYKVCPRCGQEYDYYQQRGVCNRCGF